MFHLYYFFFLIVLNIRLCYGVLKQYHYTCNWVLNSITVCLIGVLDCFAVHVFSNSWLCPTVDFRLDRILVFV